MPSDKTETIKRIPLYIKHGDGQLFAVLHINRSNYQSKAPVILCPASGLDYMNAHRGLLDLSDELASQGSAVLRIDYLGTGSSSDSVNSDELEDYIDSVRSAVRFMKDRFLCEQIGLIGFRLGAAIASIVASEIDCEYLVLWGGIYQGRRLIRELRALQQTGSVAGNQGQLEAGGWLISSETENSLGLLDISELNPKTKKIFLVVSDSVKRHQKLQNAWANSSNDISICSVSDILDMLVDAHSTSTPFKSIEEISSWVSSLVKNNQITKLIDFDIDNSLNNSQILRVESNSSVVFTEEPKYFNYKKAQFYFKVSSFVEKKSKIPLIIFLNSGSNHYAGPHRLYVTLSRALASLGFNCLLLDLPGLGESKTLDGEEPNLPYMVNPSMAIRACLESLPDQDKPESIILLGLCSGAYHSFLAAIEIDDFPIVESILINPLTFYWEQGMELEEAQSEHYGEWAWYKQALKNKERWKKLITGQLEVLPIFITAYKRAITLLLAKLTFYKRFLDDSPDNVITEDISSSLMKLFKRKIALTMVFAQYDPGIDILFTNARSTVKKLINKKQIKLVEIEGADHTFSQDSSRSEFIEVLKKYLSSKYLDDKC